MNMKSLGFSLGLVAAGAGVGAAVAADALPALPTAAADVLPALMRCCWLVQACCSSSQHFGF
jgi:hypothetical protein